MKEPPALPRALPATWKDHTGKAVHIPKGHRMRKIKARVMGLRDHSSPGAGKPSERWQANRNQWGQGQFGQRGQMSDGGK